MAVRTVRMVAPGQWLGYEAVVNELRRMVGGNQKAWAKKHGISQAYVNDVLRFRKMPGDKITRAMGLERALLWRTPGRAEPAPERGKGA